MSPTVALINWSDKLQRIYLQPNQLQLKIKSCQTLVYKKRIANKAVAITGASNGIGRVTAELLAAQGAKVIIGARSAERLKEIVDQINENGGEGHIR